MHAGVGATNSCHAKKEAGSNEPTSFLLFPRLAAGSPKGSRETLT